VPLCAVLDPRIRRNNFPYPNLFNSSQIVRWRRPSP
jgi:hypothetical protein